MLSLSKPIPLLLLLLLTVTVRSESGSDDPCPRISDDPCPRISDGSSPSCPVSCFRPDPVCGADGVTYWCGCTEAACAGATVAKAGFCQVGSGGTGLVSGQAFLLVHIIWLILLGFSVLCGLL